jgi:hypothetical protein
MRPLLPTPSPPSPPPNPGKRVVVLEARAVGAGASGRHPGDASTWNHSLYSRLQSWYGSDITKQVGDMCGVEGAGGCRQGSGALLSKGGAARYGGRLDTCVCSG